jgi:putative heme iron utilization protein
MSEKPRPIGNLFGSIDVSANPNSAANTRVSTEELVISLLRQMVTTQDRQTKLMEEMVNQLSAAQKQRAAELGAWKDQNPELAEKCKKAAESLNKVQTQFLQGVADEVIDADDALLDSEYMLNEFVDRFGPRMVHLNGILQVLVQLSAGNTPAPQ